MAWFSVIKNIDMDRLKEEVNVIKAMIEDYRMERNSAREELDGFLFSIAQELLDGELNDDKDIRRIADDLAIKSGFDVEDFDELLELLDKKLEADEE